MEAAPSEEAAPETAARGSGSLGSVLQSTTFLHRFGLYLEQKAQHLRPLLYFCVDVERLRLQAGEDTPDTFANPASCEHIIWTYLKPGSPRSLHRCQDSRLVPVPDPDASEEPIGIQLLLELQSRAQDVLQQDLLPGFMETEGAHLESSDRKALEEEFAAEAPQAEPLSLEQCKKEALMVRDRYLSRLGFMPGNTSEGPSTQDDITETYIDLGAPDTVISLEPISEEQEAPQAPAAPPKPPESEVSTSSALDSRDPVRSALKSEKTSLDDFRVLKVLGKGSFGTVVKVVQKSTDAVYAMKVMSKKELVKKKALRHIRRERSVLEYVSHPFVVGLLHAFITEAKVYLVLEFCGGGDLHQHLMQSETGRFTEEQSRFYTAELVLALEYLHDLGVIYRDLKPENVLLDEDGHVRLADFGLCRAGVKDDVGAQSFCGSPAYLSPEMVNRAGHGQATDWWGLGVLLYEMATGDPPFQGRDIEGLFHDIKEQEVWRSHI